MTKHVIKKVIKYVKPTWVLKSELRICQCCGKKSLILKMNESEEFWRCIHCKANQRYEVLGSLLRMEPNYLEKVILEMDMGSPLYKGLLSEHPHYIRTFYSDHHQPGECRVDGSRCEDITNMTFADESIDLMITSDVLEHVPDLDSAFRETARVLRPGGKHYFSIPMTGVEKTMPRATINQDGIVHLLPPEYHCDPSAEGNGEILVFWNFAKDLEDLYSNDKIKITVASGPFGIDGKMVWCAEKR